MPTRPPPLPAALVSIVLLALTACSGRATSSEANDAILAELHVIPGATEVRRTLDGSSIVVTYRIEDVPGAAVLEFYLASLPAGWELTEPLGDAPEAIAFCRGEDFLRLDAARTDADGTFTLEARAAASEQCG